MTEPLFPIRPQPIHAADGPFVIHPYRHADAWVFDEPRVGLEKEPIVSGITEMVDRLVANIPDATNGFRLSFAGFPFEGHQAVLNWVRSDPVEGNWYRDGEEEGWLCPAMSLYFSTPPEKIFGGPSRFPFNHFACRLVGL